MIWAWEGAKPHMASNTTNDQPQPADLNDADLVDQFAYVRDKMGTEPDCEQNDVWVQQSNRYRIDLLRRLARAAAPPSGQVCVSREDATVIGRELLATGINGRPDTDAYQAYRRLLAAIKGSSA